MTQDVRITVDSVLDKDRVRVLISTDGKREKPVIMEKKALARLLQVQELGRKIEGDVYTVPDRTATVSRFVDRARPARLRPSDIPADVLRLRKPRSATGAKRTRIRNLQKRLRSRMGGV